jgi:hypothetical protein
VRSERADAVMLRRPHEQLLLGLVLGRAGLGEHVGGDHPLGEVVQPGEVVRSPACRDLTGAEQVLERELAVVPVPPRALRPVAHLEVARHDRALGAHPVEHPSTSDRFAPPTCAATPAGMLVHRPPLQGMELDRGRGTPRAPSTRTARRAGRVVDQRARMRAEPGEQRQLLAAHQHVDRVDLDEPHPVDDAAQVTPIDATGRARVGEPLRAEREPSRLSADSSDGGRHRRTVPRDGADASRYDVSRRRR